VYSRQRCRKLSHKLTMVKWDQRYMGWARGSERSIVAVCKACIREDQRVIRAQTCTDSPDSRARKSVSEAEKDRRSQKASQVTKMRGETREK